MAWLSSPTAATFVWRAPSSFTISNCAQFVSWNSSTRMCLNLRWSPASTYGRERRSLRACTIWSPKSMAPLAAISSWYFARTYAKYQELEGVHDLVAEVDGAARGHQLL